MDSVFYEYGEQLMAVTGALLFFGFIGLMCKNEGLFCQLFSNMANML
ncbi:MAG: hypothetical protein K6F37_09165 [Lachnospiraceae bacterium]|nr:hypothetical protein [Lachnospiraceae bacterium]